MGSVGTAAVAAALASASPSAASDWPSGQNGPHDVAVALVDLGANSLVSKDSNVRFVDLTPQLKEGDRHAVRRVGKMDHGDIVAQSFVDEYRRIDPQARITFYTVNPFVERGMGGSTMFSRSMLQQALPKLKETNVRVAITTFGVDDEVSGNRILKDFQDAGLVVFAASPNSREDRGIWPAASPSVISVADGVTGDSGFMKNRSWANWVDVVGNGIYHKGEIDTDGSSFATPRVAAYGAYLARAKPDIGVDEMRSAIVRSAVTVRIHDRDFPKVGGDVTASRFREQVAALGQGAQVAAAPRPAPRVAASMAMMASMGSAGR
jgi:hypothetical protein